MTKSNKSNKSETPVEYKTKAHTYHVLPKYSGLSSVSAVIRAMTADGFSRGEIAKSTRIRYQHVRNVLITPLSK